MFQISEEKIHHLPRFFMLLSIPALLYIGLLSIDYFNLVSLKLELHSIIIILIILLIFMFFIIHNAWYAFSFFRNSFNGVIEDVEVFLTKNQLMIAGKSKAFGNIDFFFDEHERKVRNDHFASVAASIFPTLGILGTFIAIAISMPDFSVESQEALESEITVLLSGIGTAFYASIYGIFLSLWWTFFEKRGLTKIQKEIDEAKAYYKTKIWNEDEIKILSLTQNQTSSENLINKLESIITPEFLFTLDNVAKSKVESIENLQQEHIALENKLSNNYINIAQLFEQTAIKQKELLEDFDTLNKSISSTNENLSTSVFEQSKHSKAMKAEIYSVLSSFELISNDLKTLGQDLIKKDIEISRQDEQR